MCIDCHLYIHFCTLLTMIYFSFYPWKMVTLSVFSLHTYIHYIHTYIQHTYIHTHTYIHIWLNLASFQFFITYQPYLVIYTSAILSLFIKKEGFHILAHAEQVDNGYYLLNLSTISDKKMQKLASFRNWTQGCTGLCYCGQKKTKLYCYCLFFVICFCWSDSPGKKLKLIYKQKWMNGNTGELSKILMIILISLRACMTPSCMRILGRRDLSRSSRCKCPVEKI